eukprot:gnl/TRDRNA2_/TRDRNA2_128606_c0_seq2.p1 gnl/TRDRNA2_/TRDRNA2_128606_c0~~gnl/TRDRNA2_/TRDRNA2_128606_c0_seq2.p1  ORF type:complete len:314 (+),score=61.76 gnl/TRDRNA2_/TRDRNA2_128606_c0_seq2:142-942(+)
MSGYMGGYRMGGGNMVVASMGAGTMGNMGCNPMNYGPTSGGSMNGSIRGFAIGGGSMGCGPMGGPLSYGSINGGPMGGGPMCGGPIGYGPMGDSRCGGIYPNNGGGLQPVPLPPMGQVEAMLFHAKLDDGAASRLRSLPPDIAIGILGQLDRDGGQLESGNVRKPSAWANSSKRRRRSYRDEREHPWVKWDLRTWLEDVDDGAGTLVDYHRVIASNFDDLEQIVDIYTAKAKSGRLMLDELFFDDLKIEKIGHKRLFERWFDRNLN